MSSPFFYVPFIIKCIASYYFISQELTHSVIPFVHFFIEHPLDNPYQFFYEKGNSDIFHYPFGMLLAVGFIEAFFVHAFSSLNSLATHIDVFLVRLPLFLADIGILVVLLSWFKTLKKEILILYWASPILFYINYVYGGLDVIPMFFLFAFLYFLTKEKDYTAFILLGLAIATKIGMIIILPFVALYLIKERRDTVDSLAKMFVPFIVFWLINWPVIFSSGFVSLVFKAKNESNVFDLAIPYSAHTSLYIVPVIVLLLLFAFASFKRYSRNVLMTFLGFSFFVFLLSIPPKESWYFWIIPFAVYFYVQRPSRSWLPLHLISLGYFMYFATSAHFAFVTSAHINSLAFTFLEGVLLLNIYIIYKNGIALYTSKKLSYKPFLLGVAGDSGSGKTTLTELLSSVFSANNTTIIAGDDMHKWERGNDKWQDYTHLDPLANELHSDIKNVYDIKQGKKIERRRYDHETGKFTEPCLYEARRLVIFEGLHMFFLDKVRKAFDLKIYVAPEDQLRFHWKILRDSKKRGYTKEQIISILEKRKDDSEKYIAVQEKHSDITISLRNQISLGKQLGESDVVLSLSLFITCANDIYLQPLVDELTQYFSVDYLIHDEKQRMKFTGDITSVQVQEIAEKLLPELDDISSDKKEWEGGYHGLMQLFVTFYIFKMLAHEEYDK